MRILFVLPHQKAARRFEGVLADLAGRGHEIHLALHSRRRADADALIERLRARHPSLTRGDAPSRDDRWDALARGLRRGRDHLRYLEPEYAGAPKLRARGARRSPGWAVRLSSRRPLRGPTGRRLLGAALRSIERTIPDSPTVVDFLRSRAPDLVAVSPLVDQPWQADYVRAARSLGLRSALLVASWDNLTNKGLIHDAPDRVYLWNDDQRREAVDLHDVPAERVVTTGAPAFDHWFGWRASTRPDEFRARLGLEPARPIVLYVCSSNFIAPDEPPFVARWLDALRGHPDERLRTANVLVRPHPRVGHVWDGHPLTRAPGVAVWPAQGAFGLDAESRADYFDSLHHSAVVVGLNTSALIEAAIVGRPVFSVLDPEYRDTQEGTLHFRYLLRGHGGPLTVARDFDEHLAHLARALAEHAGGAPFAPDFVRRFVRPHGLERAAGPIVVDGLEAQMASPPPRPAPARVRRALGGVALRPLAALASRGDEHRRRDRAARRRARKGIGRARRAAG